MSTSLVWWCLLCGFPLDIGNLVIHIHVDVRITMHGQEQLPCWINSSLNDITNTNQQNMTKWCVSFKINCISESIVARQGTLVIAASSPAKRVLQRDWVDASTWRKYNHHHPLQVENEQDFNVLNFQLLKYTNVKKNDIINHVIMYGVDVRLLALINFGCAVTE